MYLPDELKQLTDKLDRKIVIHVGAHKGEEAPIYHIMGAERVLWIEANPHLMPALATEVARFPGQIAVRALLASKPDLLVPFFVTNNGQSSSMLPLKDHSVVYPHITVSEQLTLHTETLDDLLDDLSPLWQANILVMDVQGAELEVLRGAKQAMQGIEVVYSEVNFRELYAGGVLVADLDAELAKYGLNRVKTVDTSAGWGDAIYTKGAKLP